MNKLSRAFQKGFEKEAIAGSTLRKAMKRGVPIDTLKKALGPDEVRAIKRYGTGAEGAANKVLDSSGDTFARKQVINDLASNPMQPITSMSERVKFMDEYPEIFPSIRNYDDATNQIDMQSMNKTWEEATGTSKLEDLVDPQAGLAGGGIKDPKAVRETLGTQNKVLENIMGRNPDAKLLGKEITEGPPSYRV